MAYPKTSANVQVTGFKDSDTYLATITKGAKGLGISANPTKLYLIISNGLVMDVPLQNGQPWWLGGYIGGASARSKKVFGIYVPIDVEEEMEVEVSSY